MPKLKDESSESGSVNQTRHDIPGLAPHSHFDEATLMHANSIKLPDISPEARYQMGQRAFADRYEKRGDTAMKTALYRMVRPFCGSDEELIGTVTYYLLKNMPLCVMGIAIGAHDSLEPPLPDSRDDISWDLLKRVANFIEAWFGRFMEERNNSILAVMEALRDFFIPSIIEGAIRDMKEGREVSQQRVNDILQKARRKKATAIQRISSASASRNSKFETEHTFNSSVPKNVSSPKAELGGLKLAQRRAAEISQNLLAENTMNPLDYTSTSQNISALSSNSADSVRVRTDSNGGSHGYKDYSTDHEYLSHAQSFHLDGPKRNRASYSTVHDTGNRDGSKPRSDTKYADEHSLSRQISAVPRIRKRLTVDNTDLSDNFSSTGRQSRAFPEHVDISTCSDMIDDASPASGTLINPRKRKVSNAATASVKKKRSF